MQGPNRERWQQLCEMAAVEQDPKKLLELVQEINQLLDEKRKRLNRKDPNGGSGGGEGSKPMKFALHWPRVREIIHNLLPYLA